MSRITSEKKLQRTAGSKNVRPDAVSSTPTTPRGSLTPLTPRKNNSTSSVPLTIADLDELLDAKSVAVVAKLNQALEKKGIFFRRWFICACLRAAELQPKRALKILTSYHTYYSKETQGGFIRVVEVEKMVTDGILIVHPRLVTTTGKRVMFMRPGRFYPSYMQTSDVIRLLQYMTQRLVEDPNAQQDGFTFVADLGGWTMSNFSRGYAFTWFLTMLVMPVKLDSFIIIDAPSWFGMIWRIIKTVMPKSFQDKWSYVTRETVNTVLPKSACPPDIIADGELDIDLRAWCEDRRIAEESKTANAEFNPYRVADEPFVNEAASSSKSARRLSSVSSSADHLKGAPQINVKSLVDGGHSSDDDGDDSFGGEINKAQEELLERGPDGAQYQNIRVGAPLAGSADLHSLAVAIMHARTQIGFLIRQGSASKEQLQVVGALLSVRLPDMEPPTPPLQGTSGDDSIEIIGSRDL